MRIGAMIMWGFLAIAAVHAGFVTYRDHGHVIGLKAGPVEVIR